jgi:hypothetical protein
MDQETIRKKERYHTIKVHPNTFFVFEQMRSDYNAQQGAIYTKVKFVDYLIEQVKKSTATR